MFFIVQHANAGRLQYLWKTFLKPICYGLIRYAICLEAVIQVDSYKNISKMCCHLSLQFHKCNRKPIVA